jgi:hypothetical protein
VRKSLVVVAFAVSVSACGEGGTKQAPWTDASRSLDEQAISKGLLPDPDGRALAGRYETRSDLGIDKFCAVSEGDSFRFGMIAVYGPESKCEGQGQAQFVGDKVRIAFDGKGSCSFDAEFDGISLRFPGVVPEGCASYCSPRANMSGTSYFFIEPGDTSAKRTLGRDIERLCR